eukprot:7910956-Pyramimonas_sp.AAC.1
MHQTAARAARIAGVTNVDRCARLHNNHNVGARCPLAQPARGQRSSMCISLVQNRLGQQGHRVVLLTPAPRP